MANYMSGRVIRAASRDELGEIRVDNRGAVIFYGIDDINEIAMKKWHKTKLELNDPVAFKISKDNFAVDIEPSGIEQFKRPLGKSI